MSDNIPTTTPRRPGRPFGSKSKSKVLRVDEFLSEAGINPVEKLMKLMPELEPKEQARVWLELQSYCTAKSKDAESQLIVNKYQTLVQVLGAEKIAALESGKPTETLEMRMLDKLSKESPQIYEALLLNKALPKEGK
jgi:hypothetical protein